MFIGMMDVGLFINNPAIAFAKTAKTNQVRHATNSKNIILTLGFITFDDKCAIVCPFSFALTTNEVIEYSSIITMIAAK